MLDLRNFQRPIREALQVGHPPTQINKRRRKGFLKRN